MEIKSKSLLPKVEEEEEDEEEVSRENLINKLIEYKKYKDITSKLKELEENRNNIYIKSPENINNYVNEDIYKEEVDVDRLIQAFKDFLDRKNMEKPLKTKITNKEYSVKERKNNIRSLLKEKGKLEFSELFDDIFNRGYVAVTFLSILEMSKEKELKIRQDKNFGNIYLEMR